MNTKLVKQIIAPVIILALIIFAYVLSIDFNAPENGVLNPAYYPRLLIYIILVMTISVIVMEFLKNKKVNSVKSEESSDSDNASKREKALTLKFISAIVLYALVLKVLGFVIATALFLISSMTVLGYKNYKNMIILTVFVTAIIYFGFSSILNVRFPSGIFF